MRDAALGAPTLVVGRGRVSCWPSALRRSAQDEADSGGGLPPASPCPVPSEALTGLSCGFPAVPAPPSLVSAQLLMGGFRAGAEAAQTARRTTRTTRRTRRMAMAVWLVGGPDPLLILAPAPSLWAPAGQPPLTQCL